MALACALDEWRAQLGVGRALDADAAQAKYGSDTSGAVRRIAGALPVRDGCVILDLSELPPPYILTPGSAGLLSNPALRRPSLVLISTRTGIPSLFW